MSDKPSRDQARYILTRELWQACRPSEAEAIVDALDAYLDARDREHLHDIMRLAPAPAVPADATAALTDAHDQIWPDDGEQHLLTEIARLNKKVAFMQQHVGAAARALVAKDSDEAYHQLYAIADPHFQRLEDPFVGPFAAVDSA